MGFVWNVCKRLFPTRWKQIPKHLYQWNCCYTNNNEIIYNDPICFCTGNMEVQEMIVGIIMTFFFTMIMFPNNIINENYFNLYISRLKYSQYYS
jgi:hypothetical protein